MNVEEREPREPVPFAKWEIAVWLVVVAIGLLVVHAVLTAAVNRANDSHVYTPTTAPVCVARYGCALKP